MGTQPLALQVPTNGALVPPLRGSAIGADPRAGRGPFPKPSNTSLNKDTFEPNPAVYAFQEASSSKDTWSMVLLVVRGLLRRPSLSGSPTVTLCSVHIHKVVAKKRDASTDLLRRLHAHMLQHNIDFIGGDFHMSAFSTVGDVVRRPRVFNSRQLFLVGAWCLGRLLSEMHGVSHHAEATI